ncbi:MAG: hypothetical protein RR320_08050, partial [Oscillospiraceae bacterium]
RCLSPPVLSTVENEQLVENSPLLFNNSPGSFPPFHTPALHAGDFHPFSPRFFFYFTVKIGSPIPFLFFSPVSTAPTVTTFYIFYSLLF